MYIQSIIIESLPSIKPLEAKAVQENRNDWFAQLNLKLFLRTVFLM